MIDSVRRPQRLLAAALLALLAAAGCAGPGGAPVGSAVEPLPSLGAYVPDRADRAARDLAAAILAGDPDTADESVARLAGIDAERREAEEPITGLLPYALAARNATLSDEIAYRRESAVLLERGDLSPELRARLQAETDDDELHLASRRIRDARLRRSGRIANALIEPVGRSITSSALLPLRLLQGVLGVALMEHQDDELTPPERQALAHWKQFIERHPDSPEATELLDAVNAAQIRWLKTQRDRNVRRGRNALEAGDAPLAAALAERALRYAPEDEGAVELLADAQELGGRWMRNRNRALGAAGSGEPDAGRALLVTLLASEGDPDTAARALLEGDPQGPWADEAAFVLALTAGERGEEGAMWRALESLADASDRDSNMARHARALTTSPLENPYRAFREARRREMGKKARWLAFGPLADGARDRDLPRPVEWAVEVPSLVGMALGLPNRIIRFPFLRAEWAVPAVLARRYLERFPEGEHAGEMRDWLRDYESGRGNHVGALKLLESETDPDPDELASLRRKASAQALEASLRERRRDVRHQLLREVARQFQGTEAGLEAGRLVREEIEQGAPQRIRISRQFLKENPTVAGPAGLALRGGLLDGDPTNGELHPDGVTLLGGRWLEFAFVGESGRDGKPPERRRQAISEERLARLVAQLEESSLHTVLVDRDATMEHDADRDLFFERARLGAVDLPDARPHAESTYAFLGMRERYGLVRSRESILPVEIVLQGSFDDFGLGAFPRFRMPKETPDVFLYR